MRRNSIQPCAPRRSAGGPRQAVSPSPQAPLAGGLMLSVFGWRSIFLVNIPLCVLGALLALKLAETERAKTRHGFDIAGQALAILSLIAITATVIEAKP